MQTLWKFWEWVTKGVADAIEWIRDFAVAVVATLFGYVDSALSALGIQTSFGDLAAVAERINYWVPLDLGITLILGYTGIWAALRAIHIVLKIIPTVW